MLGHSYAIFLLLMLSFTVHVSCQANGQVDLKGIHFVFVVIQNPPFETVINHGNGSITLLGATNHVNEWLSRRLNYTFWRFSFILPPENEINKLGWTLASFIQVNKGLANVTVSPAVITPERRSLADEVIFPMFGESVRLVVPRPSEEDRLFAFILPFDPWVWILLVASTVLTVLILSCLIWSYNNFTGKTKHLEGQELSVMNSSKESYKSLLGSYSMYVVDILTNHGDYVKHTYINSFVVLVTFWLLGVSVLIFSYSSIVVSSLTAPRLKPSINSYEDLASSKDVALILRTDLVPTKRVLDGENLVFRQIAEKARKHFPESITHDVALTETLLTTGRYAFTWLETYVRFFVATRYKKEKKCRFQMSSIFRGSSYFYHQFMKKGLNYRDAFKLGNMQLWETGLTRFWTRRLLPRAEECFAKNTDRVQGSQAKIKLGDLTSAFFILGVGLCLSLVAFLLEIYPCNYPFSFRYRNELHV